MGKIRDFGLLGWHAFRILWGVLIAGVLQLFGIFDLLEWTVQPAWVWVAAAFTVALSVAVVQYREKEAHRRRWVGENLQQRKLDLTNIINEEPTDENYTDWQQRAGNIEHSIASYIKQELPPRYLARFRNVDQERPQEIGQYLPNGEHFGWKMKLIHQERRLESVIQEIGHAGVYPELVRRSELRRSEHTVRGV